MNTLSLSQVIEPKSHLLKITFVIEAIVSGIVVLIRNRNKLLYRYRLVNIDFGKFQLLRCCYLQSCNSYRYIFFSANY